MDAAFPIAKSIVNLRYEDIPPEVVEVTKRSIFDTLGVTAAASTTGQGCKEVVELVKESGAKGKSTIIGYGGRVPSWMAGFANGSMVHQLDYDDFFEQAALHPSACTVTAAFAVAEEVGGVNGKELIVAVASAIDLVVRMGLAISGANRDVAPSGWFLPPLLGCFSATAAAGRILGLSEDGMLDAFGHTLQQAAGSRQVVYNPGSIFRGIRDAFPIKAGILSALMAKKGLPGTKDSLEGTAGLYNLYFRGAYERSYLTDELGKRFENTRVGFKPWPACRVIHASVDATLGILSEHDIRPEDIEELSVSVTGRQYRLLYESFEARRRPQTSTDAKYSIPFTLGVAATRRKVVIKDFTPDGLKDTAVLQMAQKVTVKIDPKHPELKDTPNSTIVEIKTKDGKQYSKRVDFAYGDPRKPIAMVDLVEKFGDCVSYSAKPISKAKVEEAINMVNKLEEVEDVSRVIRLLG